ncbi:MAG TPA: Nif3-like dinuclear metal center hexameric protein [Gudongella oleilytica]|nr:Nif3-like dinuclear metal center hexameric protein [Gudongella oleilytica]
MKISEIVGIMEEWADPCLMDSWDNGGLQYGSMEQEINGILISLDVTEEVLEYAIKFGSNLIISHHPLIFKGIKDLSLSTHQGRMAYKIIKNDLGIYCAHSSLDLAPGGVNDVLADEFGILNSIPLRAHEKRFHNGILGYGRVGDIEPLTLEELVRHVKDRLGVEVLSVYGETKDPITRLAVCGGSGADFIEDAASFRAQAYITGDIKYHDAQLARELGIVLIDATHYHTEKPVLYAVKNRLKDKILEEMNMKIYEGPTFAVKRY